MLSAGRRNVWGLAFGALLLGSVPVAEAEQPFDPAIATQELAVSERQRRATGLHSPTVGQQVPATQEQPPQAEQQAGSREEELLETREQKLTTVKPAKPSRLGAILARFESRGFQQATTAQFGHFYVGVGQVSEVSGLAPGALYERRRVIATPWTFQAIGGVSFLGYQVYGLRFGHFRQPAPYDFLGDGFLGAPFEFDERAVLPPQRYLYIDTHYSSFPDEAFYGIGPDSEFDDRVHFRQEAFSLDGVGGYQITRWFAVQARAGWIDTNVGPPVDTNLVDAATRFNDQDVPGIDFQADYWRLDASFYLSYLGDPNNPSGSLGLRLGRYNDADGDRFDFLRVSLDARGYLPLGSRQRVLAARFYTSSDFPDSDAEVPFYLMGTLGGPYKLRGFADQRFRDRNLIFITGEYRWEASPGLEFAVFYGAGKVFHEYSERNFDHLQHNWGGGVRFKNMRRVVLRLDLGSSDEGTYFQFNFGPSF